MQAPLVADPQQDNDYLRQFGYDEIPATFGQAFDAVVGEEFFDFGVTSSIRRLGEYNEAIGKRPQGSLDYGFQQTRPKVDETAIQPMSEEDWRESEFYRDGLDYDANMTPKLAEILADRKDKRDRREDILNRYDGNALSGTALFTTRIMTQLLDPVGVAAGFIPVVGQARYLALAERLGRPGARLVVGATEGLVGNALVEPLVFAAAQRDQLDYTMADSLANIAIGGVFGSGFRTVGGAVADALSKRGRRMLDNAADLSIRQAAVGADINVAPVLRADYEARIADVKTAQAKAAAKAVDDVIKARQAEAERPLTIDERRELFTKEFEAQFPATEVQTGTGRQRLEVDAASGVPVAKRNTVRRAGPMDIITWLRSQGGLQDDAGELRSRDLVRARGRDDVQFAKGEAFLGKLVRDEGGMRLDDAALRAWEHGYLQGPQRPTPDDLLRAIDDTMRAGGDVQRRVWRADQEQAVFEYDTAMKSLDEEEVYTADAGRTPANGVERSVNSDLEDYGFDPIDLEGIDDPEFLLREEMERSGIADGGEVAPDDPVVMAERQGRAAEAAAACLSRAVV